ncbi:hypothetical protein AJ80_09931 [Polytolypa hystricis UAMH7299]|uniref:RING-type domain-containing protein n=1 Tax=Polytolypa hystricis (strain UAMH7299) TaxID=1447883 RepID=A0A2B7WGG4_POLH7|nr:hypothetical protein AJ80_09931 [Polytolypa hystricis UAMH7299]
MANISTSPGIAIDSRIRAFFTQYLEEIPSPPVVDSGAPIDEPMDDGMCAVCHQRYFLPIEWGPCGHVFCMECLWHALVHLKKHMPHVALCCFLCRETVVDFKYSEASEQHNTSRSHEECGRFSLRILFAKLQDADDAMVEFDFDHPELKVAHDSNLQPPTGNEGLSEELLRNLNLLARERAADEEWDDNGWSDSEDEEEEDPIMKILTNLLHLLPVDKLKGKLAGMRFTRVIVQKRLEKLAPYYQNW